MGLIIIIYIRCLYGVYTVFLAWEKQKGETGLLVCVCVVIVCVCSDCVRVCVCVVTVCVCVVTVCVCSDCVRVCVCVVTVSVCVVTVCVRGKEQGLISGSPFWLWCLCMSVVSDD